MKVNEILALINAGYTKEEIAEFSKAQGEQPEQPEKKEPEQPEKKEPESLADPVKELSVVVSGLAAQVKAMQADNIAAARQEEPKKENSDSIIKSFIEKM